MTRFERKHACIIHRLFFCLALSHIFLFQFSLDCLCSSHKLQGSAISLIYKGWKQVKGVRTEMNSDNNKRKIFPCWGFVISKQQTRCVFTSSYFFFISTFLSRNDLWNGCLPTDDNKISEISFVLCKATRGDCVKTPRTHCNEAATARLEYKKFPSDDGERQAENNNLTMRDAGKGKSSRIYYRASTLCSWNCATFLKNQSA